MSSSCSTTSTLLPRSRSRLAACRSAARCRAGAGRCWARPARTSRRSGRSRSGWPAGCAGPRRRTACPRRDSRRQVAQPHVVEKAQPRSDLAHHLVGDLAAWPPWMLKAVEPGLRMGQGGMFDLVDRQALVVTRRPCGPRSTCRASRLQPRALALRGRRAPPGSAPRSSRTAGGVGLAPAPLEVGDDPFPRMPALDVAHLARRWRPRHGRMNGMSSLPAAVQQQSAARPSWSASSNGLRRCPRRQWSRHALSSRPKL